ncbi:MAG TPA: hypothetical protein VHX44_18145 [Planctomycetota bacterium]|nr:hypothetical protein [Planctomycetota bacterium]
MFASLRHAACVLTFTIAGLSAADPSWTFAPSALTPPPGKDTIGNGHGEIRVDSAGNFYVSVDGQKEGGLQVYSPEGKFLRYVPNTPSSLHGFVIRQEDGQDVIYAAVLGQSRVLKLKTDGTVLLEIPKSAFPADKGDLKLTSVDVAPNGDLYIVDGYGKDWIFVFDKAGTFKTVLGGRGEPLKLSNAHKIFFDPRFDPPRLLVCDRGNNRILHVALDGTLISVFADKELRRPSSASFHGDYVCIAEIAGRVSVFDKEGKQIAKLGVNDTQGQTNTPKVEPKDWKDDVVTSPHGITFDAKGNIFETEWNQWGRVLRWNIK